MEKLTISELIKQNQTLKSQLKIAVEVLENLASLNSFNNAGHDAEYWLDKSMAEANKALSQIQSA